MRKVYLIPVVLLASLIWAQISVTDTLGTRLLPECGWGITKLGTRLYVPAGRYGIRIYDIHLPHTVTPEGEYKTGEYWESELAVDAVAFTDPTGHRRMAVVYQSPTVLMRFFDLTSYSDPSLLTTITPSLGRLIGQSVSYNEGRLILTARYSDDNQGVFYFYNVRDGNLVGEYHWWSESGRIITDGVYLPGGTGSPDWIVISMWDSAGVGGGNALRSFAIHDDGYITQCSTYTLAASAHPHNIVPGWSDGFYTSFYVALGPNGAGAFKINRLTGAIQLINTVDDTTMSDIVDISRWGNRLFMADHCTTYSASAYALHIFEIDTVNMGISTTPSPVHIHGRNARAVWGDSSSVWIVADMPQGSDSSPGAR